MQRRLPGATAEAVLLPVLAKHCLYPGGTPEARAKQRAFRAVTIVNVGSVDFRPYITLLLGEVNGCRLVDPLVVITESSSTGENLLDRDQPVFCAAAVHLKDSLAQQIVDGVKAQLPSTHGEPKYTALSQTGTGRDALIDAFDTPADESILAFIAHKRFMVVTKMVDVLVEELAHETGFNLYDGDAVLGLANLYQPLRPRVGRGQHIRPYAPDFRRRGEAA